MIKSHNILYLTVPLFTRLIAYLSCNGKDRLFCFCSCWIALAWQAITEINVRAKWIWDLAEKNTEDKLQVCRKCFIYQHTDFFFKQVLSLYWSLKVYIYMLYFFQWHLICILSFWPTATGVISVCYSQFVSESFVSSGAVLEC